MSESITKKVILIIILFMFLSPITDSETYKSDLFKMNQALCHYINNIYNIYNGEILNEYNNTLSIYIQNSFDNNLPTLNITFNNTLLIWQNLDLNFNNYESDEIIQTISPDGVTIVCSLIKTYNKLSALISIGRTAFSIAVLFYMAVVLELDIKTMILDPLEAMIEVVDSVAKDPINFKVLENLKRKTVSSIQKVKSSEKQYEQHQAEYEIKVIQIAIVRISALLAIGFGEAGGEILRENISSQQGLNPMMAGLKKVAIFGFCDIRHFQDINVALQEKTMMFVNEIADIVHSCVDKFGGAANKNIGDAFLMVWKFSHLDKSEDKQPIVNIKDLNINDKNNNYMADQAVLGFLNVIKKVKKSATIASYSFDPEIVSRYGDKFKVQMGFGLHIGWGIEGAIGSFYKIDCSYLSPNVNISARLEGATRQYGVNILISGELYDLLSPDIKNICHLIDIVTLKGSISPVRLYTIYINSNLKPSKNKENKKSISLKEKRKYYNKKRNELKDNYNSLQRGGIGKIILNRKGFVNLLNERNRPLLFHEKFSVGFNAYIEGNWELAYENFRGALFLDNTNGPTKTLMSYIKNRDKKAPENWLGYRELTSK